MAIVLFILCACMAFGAFSHWSLVQEVASLQEDVHRLRFDLNAYRSSCLSSKGLVEHSMECVQERLDELEEQREKMRLALHEEGDEEEEG